MENNFNVRVAPRLFRTGMERIMRGRNFAGSLSGASLKKVFITHFPDCFYNSQERW
jgi:hypothetical protein